MEPDRRKGQQETPSGSGRRREHGDEEHKRRHSWIGDAELARSLNAAIQDEDGDDGDD